VKDRAQALQQSKIAFKKGADGIFLINHFFLYKSLFEIYKEVRKSFSNRWIGLNCLDLTPLEFFSINFPKKIDGLWDDNARIDENRQNQEYPEQVLAKIKESGWKGLYFGGVAFKYQKEVTQIRKATKIASKYMDVITTSGAGTGISADLEKIAIMGKIASQEGSHLAVASGITADNIQDYPDAHFFLVATGVSKDFFTFDPQKLEYLVSKIERMIKNQ